MLKTCSDSNFNQKFDYDYGTHGLSWDGFSTTFDRQTTQMRTFQEFQKKISKKRGEKKSKNE